MPKKKFTKEDKARLMKKEALKNEGKIDPNSLAAKVQSIVDSQENE